MKKKPVAAVEAWTVQHGRFVFIDYIRTTKCKARAAALSCYDKRWTWKRLYRAGARVVPVTITVAPQNTQRGG